VKMKKEWRGTTGEGEWLSPNVKKRIGS